MEERKSLVRKLILAYLKGGGGKIWSDMVFYFQKVADEMIANEKQPTKGG